MGGPPFHVKQILTDAERMGLALASDSADRLIRLTDVLGDRALRLGLVAKGDAGRLYPRHVRDCLRAAALIEESDRRAYDLGSGAGLPGLVLAIAVPACSFVLVESRRRAAAFLEWAVAELEVRNASVAPSRVEDMEGQADLAAARAFAPLDRAWEAAVPLLRPGGRLVYFAGAGLRDPEGAARSLARPEPAGSVRLDPVFEKAAPLVIMSRKE
jgi:16S rRNA (guanine527-N7)-methyltransferase